MGSLQEDNLSIVKTMAANGILGKWDLVKQYVSDDMVMHSRPACPTAGTSRLDGYLQCSRRSARSSPPQGERSRVRDSATR